MNPPNAAISQRVRWRVPAEPTRIGLLRREVANFARRAGVGEPRLINVQLAVSEAITNAVVHAYPVRERGAPASDRPDPARVLGEVQVDAEVCGRELIVRVRDFGVGMQLRSQSPGLGLGMRLIDTVARTYAVRPCSGGGTEVRMSFALDGQERASASGRGAVARGRAAGGCGGGSLGHARGGVRCQARPR